VAEDWRVTVTLHGPGQAARLAQGLGEKELEEDARERLGQRVAVSGGDSDRDSQIFLYADGETAAREAERVVRELVEEHGLEADFTLDRWHPLEERWEDAAVPLPQTEEERQAERERLEAEETAESQASGVAAWEVKAELDTHDDASELADRLEAEGWPVVRRWKYVLVGCSNEDEARQLAARLEQDVPRGAEIAVEPGSGLAWEAMPSNPFAVFGGLGT
jgi:hypothetical protein